MASSSSGLIRPGLTTGFSRHLPAIKLRLRRKLPKLSFDDVRRARILYYEALASELYETGCINAAFLLLQLIEYEDDHVLPTSTRAVEAKRLRNHRQLLDYLFATLRNAEGCKNRGLQEDEVMQLLQIARKVQLDPGKWWLARQFYLIALDRCAEGGSPEMVNGRCATLARYYYGKLLMAMKQPLNAMIMLEAAEKRVKTDEQHWYPLDSNEYDLLVVLNRALFKVYQQLRNATAGSEPWISEQYQHAAHKAALKIKHSDLLGESFLVYGDLLSQDGKHEDAADKYRQSLRNAKVAGNSVMICTVSLRLAITYQRLNEPTKSDSMLLLGKRMSGGAEQSKCLGDFYFVSAKVRLQRNDTAQVVGAEFRKASEMYRKLALEDQMADSWCYETIVRRDEDFSTYVDLLRGSSDPSENLVHRVIDWIEGDLVC